MYMYVVAISLLPSRHTLFRMSDKDQVGRTEIIDLTALDILRLEYVLILECTLILTLSK